MKSSTVKYCWLVVATLLVLARLQAQGDALFPPKPEPAVYVHDLSGWLSAGERMQLEQKLRAYFDSTSTQIVVMIRPDIGDYDKSSYAFELGNRWGIGRKDKDNGVVVLIKTEQPGRGVFIATGYGAEGALPDITAGRIVRNTIIPYFQKQRYYEGIDAGTNDIISALAGEYVREEEPVNKAALLIALLIFLLIVIGFAFIAYQLQKNGTWYTNTGRTHRHTPNPWGGGWYGGGWGGGGSGWGGGGGGGSFGGGSFGGGGAGGDW